MAEKVEHMNSVPTIVSDAYKKLAASINPSKKELLSGLPKLGPLKFKDGSTYEGQFKEGKKHGYGKLVSPSATFDLLT